MFENPEKMILELSCIFLWRETHFSHLGQWHYATVERRLMLGSGRRGGLWWHSFLCLFRERGWTTAAVLRHRINEFKMLWPPPRVSGGDYSIQTLYKNWKDVWLMWAHKVWPTPLLCAQLQFFSNTKATGRSVLSERVFCFLQFGPSVENVRT